MARASVETMLPLDTFARVLGINPVHFNGGFETNIWPVSSACGDAWPQHPWQVLQGLVSREEVAMEIQSAEEEVKHYIGYSPFLTWESEEFHLVEPQIGWVVTPKIYKANFGKVIEPGRRAVTLIEAGSTVTYSDPDGDGFDELATITATTTLTNAREVKIYFAGEGGAPEWEIRPVIDKSIAGGVATVTVESWKLIDPDLWEAYPGPNGIQAIDVDNPANLVSTVDVYREYTDHSQPSAQFFWSQNVAVVSSFADSLFTCGFCGGTGCQVCTSQVQDGCLGISDHRSGMITPLPATYDADTDKWTRATWACQGNPQQFKIWYRAGHGSKRYSQGLTTDPDDFRMAQVVTWIAASRLGKDICDCTNVRNIVKDLQRDMTRSDQQGAFTRFRSMDIFECPFGLHYGEVRAFQVLKNFFDTVNAGGGF